ncbi:MAG: hypothetical protein DYG93_07735 [Leptolyngbya sp. PLA2]|nr:hypothetical protein [Leptolyngbya sp.]MCE7971538.1 hypothetical protein [Leptolyngbya sp. PL-A2]MCQ3940752.1 hypothetical protein [cyanobacterium CYA1]MDL1903722.1 hypothetical protein [Synechococcales cyanobacterium CNB]
MRTRARIERLERKRRERPCALCGGHGHDEVLLQEEGEPEVEPRGCKACGRVRTVRRIILAAEAGP